MRASAFNSFQGSGVGTNAGVTVTITGIAGRKMCPRGIQASGDLAALVTIESPAGTPIWRKRMTGTGWTLSESFGQAALKGAAGQDVLVKISASTANCEANLQAESLT